MNPSAIVPAAAPATAFGAVGSREAAPPAFEVPEPPSWLPPIALLNPPREDSDAVYDVIGSLNSMMSGLELLESRARAIEASKLEILAEIIKITQRTDVRPAADGPAPASSLELAYRSARAEVAATLDLSEHSAERQMGLAYTITRDYPLTHALLESGSIALAHADVIAAAGTVIGSGDGPGTVKRRAMYEDAVLGHAVEETPARLRPIAKRLAEQFAEQSIDERHEQAVRLRRVTLTDLPDGMADLVAHLPATEAHAIYDRLTRMGRQVRLAARIGRDEADEKGSDGDARRADATRRSSAEGGSDAEGHSSAMGDSDAEGVSDTEGCSSDDTAHPGGGDTRGLDEVRADLFSDLLLASNPDAVAGPGLARIQAHVQVVVHEGTLLGAGPIDATPGPSRTAPANPRPASAPQPAFLAGHGPIDGGSARALAEGAAHWDRVTTHPDTGEVLSVDRYRPSKQIRRLLAARDPHCRFPGCRAPHSRCDIDHTVDAALGGPTSTNNLAALCLGHHVLKHHTGWRVSQQPGGVLEWRSPTG